MNFILIVFISTAWWLQSFHKSTKIMWSTGGNQEKTCSKMKLNLGCKFSFFPPALIRTFPGDELPGREKINLWLEEQPLFVFNSCVCLLSAELGLLSPSSSWRMLRSCTHRGSLVAPCSQLLPIFGCSLRPDLEVCVNQGWEQLSNQNQEPGGSCLGLDLPPAPFLRALHRLLCFFLGYFF